MKTLVMSLCLLFCAASCVFSQDKERIEVDEHTALIDVRTKAEFNSAHLDGAINIPYDRIREEIGEHVTNQNARVILYCRSGRRSGIAEKTLLSMGYINVTNAGARTSIEIIKKDGGSSADAAGE